MMETREKKVSTHDLFPLVKELLADNRQAVFTVTGYSMIPFLGNGRDQVKVEKRDAEKLKKGDIILFQQEEKPYDYILHRIYRIKNGKFQTMGDGNTYMDDPVSPQQIIGVVTTVYRKGREIDCHSRRWRAAAALWRANRPFRGIVMDLYKMVSKYRSK